MPLGISDVLNCHNCHNILTRNFISYSLCGNIGKLCRSGTAAVTTTTPTTAAASSALALCDARGYHEVVGDIICPSQVRGVDNIRDPRLNKVNDRTQL